MNYIPDEPSNAEILACLACPFPECPGVCYRVSSLDAVVSRRKTPRITKWKHTAIRCVETGEVFRTLKEAAASVHRGCATMSKHLSGESAHCGGRHFERLEDDV